MEPSTPDPNQRLATLLCRSSALAKPVELPNGSLSKELFSTSLPSMRLSWREQPKTVLILGKYFEPEVQHQMIAIGKLVMNEMIVV
jgi:hypothetical protein